MGAWVSGVGDGDGHSSPRWWCCRRRRGLCGQRVAAVGHGGGVPRHAVGRGGVLGAQMVPSSSELHPDHPDIVGGVGADGHRARHGRAGGGSGEAHRGCLWYPHRGRGPIVGSAMSPPSPAQRSSSTSWWRRRLQSPAPTVAWPMSWQEPAGHLDHQRSPHRRWVGWSASRWRGEPTPPRSRFARTGDCAPTRAPPTPPANRPVPGGWSGANGPKPANPSTPNTAPPMVGGVMESVWAAEMAWLATTSVCGTEKALAVTAVTACGAAG